MVRQANTERDYWHAVLLERVAETIRFLSERGLAFRGSNEIIGPVRKQGGSRVKSGGSKLEPWAPPGTFYKQDVQLALTRATWACVCKSTVNVRSTTYAYTAI